MKEVLNLQEYFFQEVSFSDSLAQFRIKRENIADAIRAGKLQ
jgi:predicted DNA-binding protein YlxM (UPF0122 family)